jgi:hypothetical protein
MIFPYASGPRINEALVGRQPLKHVGEAANCCSQGVVVDWAQAREAMRFAAESFLLDSCCRNTFYEC